MRILPLLLAVLSCGSPDDGATSLGGHQDAELAAKRDLYVSLLPTVADGDGFVETDTCDSIHWSALTASAVGPINIGAAFDAAGKLHRRPATYPECYPADSKSENSRDAFLMVLVYGLQWQDLGLVDGIFRYGRSHLWIMGRGAKSRTLFTPNMQGLYAQAIAHLGGDSYLERLAPIVWVSDLTGYEAHLQVVSVLAYGRIHGEVSARGLEVLAAYHAAQPRNPLFAAAYYRYSGDDVAKAAAIATLSDEALFPSDRLPESSDRCAGWLSQRDEGADWQPCPDEDRVHSGGDFLFAEAVLAGRIL